MSMEAGVELRSTINKALAISNSLMSAKEAVVGLMQSAKIGGPAPRAAFAGGGGCGSYSGADIVYRSTSFSGGGSSQRRWWRRRGIGDLARIAAQHQQQGSASG